MTKQYFGTDGIRQPAESFTPGFIQTITSGLIRYAGTARESDSGAERPLRVLVGGDTRESSEWMINDFETALETVGVEHASVGVLPTPAINFAFYDMGFDLAIDITASHNPYTDNGVKIFERGEAIGGLEAAMPGGVNFKGTGANDKGEDLSSQIKHLNYGVKLSQHGVNSIEAALNSETGFDHTVAIEYSENLHDDAMDRYVDYVKQYINAIGPKATAQHAPLDLSGFKIGLDCANGATSVTAAPLFESFGAAVEVIHSDSRYNTKINQDCGSTHLESLQKLVKTKQLDFGAAFDGDGDRCLLVDHDGTVIDGDEIIAAITSYLGVPKVAVTVMANQGLLNWCESENIAVEITPVGDAHVFRAMVDHDILLGGEQSGHIILPGQPMGDGVLTALLMSKIFSERRREFEATDSLLLDSADSIDPASFTLKNIIPMHKTPETLLNFTVSDAAKQALQDTAHPVQSVIKRFEADLAEKHWRLLIRPSGTEPLIRISVWGDDQAAIEQTAADIATALQQALKTELEAQ